MTAFFPQASHFSIQGQTINFVAGDQVTHNHQVHTGDSDTIVSPGVLGTQSIFDDMNSMFKYEIIRRGNLRLLEEISKEVIDENDHYYYRRAHHLQAQKHLKFTRSAYRVQVIGQNLPRSVAVVYGGEDAQAAWERDFLLCSINHHTNVAHLFGLTRSAFSPGLVFYNDLIPVRRLWDNGSAIIRCYIAHRFRKDIDSHLSDHCFLSVINSIIGDTWSVTFLQPDTGVFCISPIHPFQDDGNRPYLGWEDPKEPALSPLPVASYDDSYILSHYLKWARGDISPELALQKDISFKSFPYPFLDYNPKQPVSLAVIRSTSPATTPTVIGKFKNLQYMVVEEELLHSSPIQNTQDMFKTIDNEMEVTIRIGEWRMGVNIVEQRNEPSINGLYKDVPGSAALLHQVSFFFQSNHKNHHPILHPEICEIFLFIAPITASHLSGTSGVDVCWGNAANDLYYWSFDPDGSSSLSKRVTEALGLPELIPQVRLYPRKFADYQYEATKQFQLFTGYNPNTQEFAQRHGLPLVDIIWPEGKTGPDKDGDMWYDCQETQDKNSNHLNEPTPPDQSSGYQFPASKKFVKKSLDENMCYHLMSEFSIQRYDLTINILLRFRPDLGRNNYDK
ncbi:hypothetical protein K435DRAFT_798416 [Dendrothele bispora CBS 962.96]|uniref:Uncharacterized protein n=1 Tax=Dendrothele bispora (strain CBS 962.96) TaxID=1314807 RepID=A0A4S8LZ85_DENBC|nr:hypothetical protein K435DRAFT_798416 [Dendrothele bispora CBS 962.96]